MTAADRLSTARLRPRAGPLFEWLPAPVTGARLLDGRFGCIGQNEVELVGGVAAAVRACKAIDNGPVAGQVEDVTPAVCCARRGDVVMVDTGDLAFRTDVDEALGARGAEVVEVGRAVPASPIVDLRFDVVGRDA